MGPNPQPGSLTPDTLARMQTMTEAANRGGATGPGGWAPPPPDPGPALAPPLAPAQEAPPVSPDPVADLTVMGYSLDPNTGLYQNAEQGLYYDLNHPDWGAFADPAAQVAAAAAPPGEASPQDWTQALYGFEGDAARDPAGREVLNSLYSRDFGEPAPFTNTQSYRAPMTAQAEAFLAQQKFPIDPNRIVYGGTGSQFFVDTPGGQELFGGLLPIDLPPNQIPRSLQPLLGPAIAQYYAERGVLERGTAPGWSSFFAPGYTIVRPEDRNWIGNTFFDAWRRPIGGYHNSVT